MRIDIANEQVIALKDAPRHIPGRPALSTVYRWAYRDHRRLDSIRVGGRRFTSVEAISRFVRQCSGESSAAVRQTPKQRQRQIDRIKRGLSDAGI